MVTFGSLYKLSSRDPSRLVWRRSYCVLQESALLCYCGWSRGWKQYPLSVAVVCRVDVGTYVGLAGLPYRLAIAHTVFELAMPEKSILVRVN